MKTVFIVTGIFLVIIISYIVYICFTYIDKTVEQGEAYGFRIGDSKKKSYQKARKVFTEKKVYILYPLDSNNYGLHKEIQFLDKEFKIMSNRNVWEIYFDDGFFDLIKLSFRNDTLISIHRHRKKIELP